MAASLTTALVALALAASNIAAAVTTDINGKQQLAFNAGSTAFQVQGGDRVSTAFLGSYSSGATGNRRNAT